MNNEKIITYEYENIDSQINDKLIGKLLFGEYKNNLELNYIENELENKDVIDDYVLYVIENIKINSITNGIINLNYEYGGMGITNEDDSEEIELSINDFISLFINSTFFDDYVDVNGIQFDKILKKETISDVPNSKILEIINKLKNLINNLLKK